MVILCIGPQRVRPNGSITAPIMISCGWVKAQSYIENPLRMLRSGRTEQGSAVLAMLAGQFTVYSELTR